MLCEIGCSVVEKGTNSVKKVTSETKTTKSFMAFNIRHHQMTFTHKQVKANGTVLAAITS